jgi:hypothetical protein
MAEGIRTRLTTAAQGRRFGLTVGGAFLALALLAWWRGHPTLATILGAPGGALALAGLVIPSYLGPVERGWMKLALAISRVTTPIVMGVMYLGVLYPVGVVRRTLGSNPLVHPLVEQSFWRSRPAGARRSASMRRQF